MKRRFFSFLSLVAAAGLTAGALAAIPESEAFARFEAAPVPGDIGQEPAHIRLAQDFVPLESILADLASQYSGHQLSVSGPSRSGDGFVYRIKWLTEDGAVLYVVADAETGQILSVEGE
ncbi:MAG: PepSY domain-containing protein [Micropepsaceae bacterium]